MRISELDRKCSNFVADIFHCRKCRNRRLPSLNVLDHRAIDDRELPWTLRPVDL